MVLLPHTRQWGNQPLDYRKLLLDSASIRRYINNKLEPLKVQPPRSAGARS